MLLLVVLMFFAFAMLGMAIGVIAQRTPLRGGCGGNCSCGERE